VFRRRGDVSAILKELRVLHVAISKAVRHLNLSEEIQRLPEAIIRGARVAQLFFQPADKDMSLGQNDSLAHGLAGVERLVQVAPRFVKATFLQVDVAEIGQDEATTTPAHVQLIGSFQRLEEMLLG
jgi:hypothetical protein